MNKKDQSQSFSLVGHGSRRYFAAAVALLAVVPLLLLWYASACGLWSQSAAVPPWQTASVVVGVSVFLALGIVLLGKYPANIARLKTYLERMVTGEFPDSVQLVKCADDMLAIQEALNVLLGRLKERIVTVEFEKDTLEKQLCQAQKLETLGILAAGITHEISAPVQFVRNNLVFVADAVKRLSEGLSRRDGAPSPTDSAHRRGHADAGLPEALPHLLSVADETREAILESEQGLSQIADIARAMKNYLHPGHGDQKSPVDINALLDETITLSRNEWKCVADVKKNFNPDLPQVPCVAGDIRQTLMNLIINAAGAIDDHRDRANGKGLITAITALRDGCVELRISDTGTGIAADVQDKIFDRFFTTKQPGKGSGLGLSLARKFIVDRHGGTLTFETEPGQGTTFIVTLPVCGEPKGSGHRPPTDGCPFAVRRDVVAKAGGRP